MIAAVLGWWHYTSLRSDLATARAAAVEAQAQARTAVAIAEGNAAALARADELHRSAIASLERSFAEFSAIAEEACGEEETIRSSPAESDGPVPDVLGDYLLRRFP